MSVVNKMLNDLDKRQAISQSSQANYQAPKKPRGLLSQKVILILVGVLIFIVSAYLAKSFIFHRVNSTPTELQKLNDLQQTSDQRQASDRQKGSTQQLQPAISQKIPPPKAALNQIVSPNQTSIPTQQLRFANAAQYKDAPRVEAGPAPNSDLDSESESKTEPSHLSIQASAGKQTINYQTKVANALALNDLHAAKLALDEWISAEPKALEARKKLASLLFADGDMAQAKDLLNETLSQFPDNTSVRLMLSRLYTKQGDLQAAWQVLQIQSSDTDLLHRRASLARQLNELLTALEDYDTLLRLQANDLKAWLGSAVVSERLGANDQAVSRFKRVQTLAEPNSDIARYALSRLATLQKEPSL